ncbi:uncharacterized protein LOC128745318 [Sabethes cyaneus]|uniref:uncharacterized protein LOC128745318 n=1 Tax=Sabethes cyaneus TaxID=53552 RepID=UPI00237EAB15|nr:uncharacterized protein LOC128745318 [Sabethes cyaneus]
MLSTSKTPSKQPAAPVASSLEEDRIQSSLASFYASLRSIDAQLRQLVGPERLAVDKTLTKAVRLELLVKNDGKLYPTGEIEHIETECLHEINRRLLATGRAVKALTDGYQQLLQAYRDLDSVCGELDWSKENSELMAGSSRQKPLEYYLQEGYRIVHQLNGLVVGFELTFNAIEIRDSSSVQRFRDCLTISEELQLYLQEYLSYAIFLLK